ncbi:hypothetical protein A6J80_23365 (plasmid) [Paracoccus yeei]|uniref:Transposase n=1 Tax=Paracoccus yeei TaxID=147645 RepID=A0A1V0GZA8_9RHOB|nr:hypothetical protein A6J80_23365 [Paracoccus yeei]
MRFAFIAKHRHIWPITWLCEVLNVSRTGYHAWLIREIARRTGLSRNTIKKYVKAPSAAPLWRQASCARINPCFAS